MVKWKDIKKAIRDPKSVWYFIQGYVRMFVITNIPVLMREHIAEQYYYRLLKAKRCNDNGSCLACGCKTPELFLSDKACGLSQYEDLAFRELIAGKRSICYPPMMNKRVWGKFSSNLRIILGKEKFKEYNLLKTKFKNVRG